MEGPRRWAEERDQREAARQGLDEDAVAARGEEQGDGELEEEDGEDGLVLLGERIEDVGEGGAACGIDEIPEGGEGFEDDEHNQSDGEAHQEFLDEKSGERAHGEGGLGRGHREG